MFFKITSFLKLKERSYLWFIYRHYANKPMENLKKIIKQFPKVGEVKEIKALTSGLINQTYLVKSVSPEEPDYVLQRINHLIFTNIEMLQHNIEVVTRHIRQKLEARHEEDIERKVLNFLPSTNG